MRVENTFICFLLLRAFVALLAFRPQRKPPTSQIGGKKDTRALDSVTLTEENYDHSIVGKEYWLDLFLGSDKPKGGDLSAQSELRS